MAKKIKNPQDVSRVLIGIKNNKKSYKNYLIILNDIVLISLPAVNFKKYTPDTKF